jgi:very-short-patch-repair endonuclease
MKTHLIWIVFAGIVIAAALLGRERPARRSALDKLWPLEPQNPLLSNPEQVLYHRLIQAVPQNIVLAQVQLMQALRFRRGRQDRSILNRFSQLSLDFLILGPDTTIVAAVELDDSSHSRSDRRDADARKNHALASAGIPLIRWTAGKLPDVETIRATLTAALAVDM